MSAKKSKKRVLTCPNVYGTRIVPALPALRPDLRTATDYLHLIWKAISDELFDGTLSRVGLTIQSQGHHSAYGWCTVAPVWHTTTNGSYHEVNISAEYLDRGIYDIVGTLVHEGVHLDNIQKGVQDCSRGNTYHNKRFRDRAEEVGLVVTHHPTYGHAITELGDELKAWVDAHGFSPAPLDLYRGVKRGPWSVPTGTGSEGPGVRPPRGTATKKKTSWKHVCPDCGAIARTSKPTVSLICGDCKVPLEVEA